MIQLNKRKGFIDDDIYIFLIIIIFGLCILIATNIITEKFNKDSYYRLDKQSIDFNGIRYKINRNSELEIYKDIITRTQHYNPVLRIFTTSTHHTYKIIKKISFDISEVN